ncbi:C-type lectin domain family 12 member B-like [Dermochelys coriacea]|uniref:C-type lectin domain family 12 member B-like n=1 Tax=Dermochelys coriacea TaxID=27794 RepID=UPI001CA8BB96|nr:C-type lectin domain family 12 member B-like [Dermochelys coriacea]
MKASLGKDVNPFAPLKSPSFLRLMARKSCNGGSRKKKILIPHLIVSFPGCWRGSTTCCPLCWADCNVTLYPQDFIRKASYQYVEDRLPYYFAFWTGLSYDPSTKKRFWMDGAALSSGLFHIPGGPSDSFQGGACAYFQGGNAKAGNCRETRFYICEKTGVVTDQLD